MVEKVKYKVIENIGDIEIRQYPEMILAVVDSNDDDSAFGLLFNYISGENTVRDKYNKDTVPIPTNPMVKIQVQPKKSFAVLRFSGYTSMSKVEKMTKQLLSDLKKYEIEIKGVPFLMRYNSPFAPGFFRRNEVAVEVFDKK